MVKKKVKKKSVKNPKIKLKKTKNGPVALRKDFDVFSKGVSRLEELKAELNNLNTSEHKAEANSIRSKLKNVSYIPKIEVEIRQLKSKIKGTAPEKGKVREVDHTKINKKINELQKEIDKKARRKQLSRDDVKSVKEIPKLESQISSLKKIVIEQQESEKRKQELLKKIDPGVDFVISNQFDLSLNEIKAELSKRLKSKQTEVQKQLQEDLEARKSNFILKYKDLENKFHEKYNERVQKELQNEIQTKFADALHKRALELKGKLENQAKIKLKLRGEELDKKKNIELERARNSEAKKLKELENKRKKLLERLALEQKKKVKGLVDARQKLTKDSMRKLGSEKSHLRELLGEENMKKLNLKERKLKLKLQKEEKRIVNELAMKNQMLGKIIEKEKEKIFKQRKKEKKRKFNQRKNEKLMNSSFEKRKMELKKHQKDLDDLKIKIEKASQKKIADIRKNLKEHSDNEIRNINNRLKDKMSINLSDKIKKQVDLLNKRYALQKSQEKRLINQLKLKLSLENERELVLEKKELDVKLSKHDVNKLRNELVRDVEFKRNNLQRENSNKLAEEKIKLKKHFEEEILATRTRLNNRVHEHLTSEIRKLNEEYVEKKKDSDNQVIQMKNKLASETGVLTRMKNNLNVKMRKIRENEDVYKRELDERLEQEKQEAIKNRVREQSALIKAKLKKDFEDRLRLEISAKEAEFEKKKADLTLDIQKKAKMLFS